MKFTRPILPALLGLSLAACSESDTVISVNVAYGDGLTEVETLRFTLEQEGNPEVEEVVDAPKVENDMMELVPDDFFHRVTLPDSWDDGEATVLVEALDSRSRLIISDEATVRVRVGTAVAAFVELAIEAEEPSPEGDAGVTPDSGTPAADGGPIVEEEAGVLEDAAVDVDADIQIDGSVEIDAAALLDAATLLDGAPLPLDGALPVVEDAQAADAADAN